MRGFLTAFIVAALASTTPSFALDLASPGADTRARLNFEIGVDLVDHQKYEEATAHLENALTEWPDDADILKYLGYAHRMIARHRVGTAHSAELRIANVYYGRALNVDPDRKDLLEFMGELYLEMDDPAAASAKLAALERHCPKSCAQFDELNAAIAAYRPPTPAQMSEPGQTGPAPTE
jgi:tetratricopeptide (TPR) repeat protein